MVLLYLFGGIIGLVAISEIASHFNKSYLVDKSEVKDWVKKFYGVDLDKSECSFCKEKTNKDNVGRIFSRNKKVYFVCKKRGCHLLTNEEVLANGNRINS